MNVNSPVKSGCTHKVLGRESKNKLISREESGRAVACGHAVCIWEERVSVLLSLWDSPVVLPHPSVPSPGSLV